MSWESDIDYCTWTVRWGRWWSHVCSQDSLTPHTDFQSQTGVKSRQSRLTHSLIRHKHHSENSMKLNYALQLRRLFHRKRSDRTWKKLCKTGSQGAYSGLFLHESRHESRYRDNIKSGMIKNVTLHLSVLDQEDFTDETDKIMSRCSLSINSWRYKQDKEEILWVIRAEVDEKKTSWTTWYKHDTLSLTWDSIFIGMEWMSLSPSLSLSLDIHSHIKTFQTVNCVLSMKINRNRWWGREKIIVIFMIWVSGVDEASFPSIISSSSSFLISSRCLLFSFKHDSQDGLVFLDLWS